MVYHRDMEALKPSENEGKTIIFVDDEIATMYMLMESLRFYLPSFSLQVFAYSQPDAFLGDLESQKIPTIDLLVLDLRMPGITGLDILSVVVEKYLEQIRACLIFSAVTAGTGTMTYTDLIRAIVADSFPTQLLSKPTSMTNFSRSVRELIAG